MVSRWFLGVKEPYPIGSMYGIFTYIYHKRQPNVGKYTIHGFYGYDLPLERRTWRTFEQNPQPPPEVKKATALVVAGNPEQGVEEAPEKADTTGGVWLEMIVSS